MAAHMTNTLLLVAALQLVESQNRPDAINHKEQAYGILQIRQPALDDVNRQWGTHYRLQDFLGHPAGTALSVLAFWTYGNLYNARTPEQYARIWNGGPKGARKHKTLRYWGTVRRHMRTTT